MMEQVIDVELSRDELIAAMRTDCVTSLSLIHI